MIPFEVFPAYRRASIVAIEMKGKKRSLAGGYMPERVLVVGQFDQTKTAVVPGVPVQLFTLDEVGVTFGFGSEIYRQAMWVYGALGGFSDNVWLLPVKEPTTGTPAAAAGDVTFAGNCTKSGTLYFSVAGDLIALPVVKDQTAANIAAAFKDAMNAAIELPVGASGATATIAVTAKWKGATGNQIKIVLNPGGPSQEAANPEGITITLPENGLLAGGSGDPDVDEVFFASGEDALGDRWYSIITCPYQNADAIAAYKAMADGRFDPAIKRFPAVPLGYVGKTYTQAIAIPATINCRFICPIWEPRSYSPDFELGAALAGAAAASALVDPGRPIKTLPLGIPCDTAVDNLAYAKLDALFRAGIGFCRIGADGTLRIGDIPTSYRTAASGAASEEWFDIESILRRQQKAYMIEQMFTSAPYDRAVLGSDDQVTSKEYVVKPKTLVTDLINMVDVWAAEGWTKNPETVKATIAAEINEGNNSRLDGTLTDDEAQALRIVAMKYAFLY